MERPDPIDNADSADEILDANEEEARREEGISDPPDYPPEKELNFDPEA